MSQVVVENKNNTAAAAVPPPPPPDNTWKYIATVFFIGYSVGYALDDYGKKFPLTPRLQMAKSLAFSCGLYACIAYGIFKPSQ